MNLDIGWQFDLVVGVPLLAIAILAAIAWAVTHDEVRRG